MGHIRENTIIVIIDNNRQMIVNNVQYALTQTQIMSYRCIRKSIHN